MTPETWKELAKQKLQKFRPTRADLPIALYGSLAGMTIWPLVETAVSTNQLAPVLMSLYGITAGVGANLVANQIETWKNRDQPPTETEVATWIADQAVANNDVRDTLNTILEKLDAVPHVQNTLNDDDRAWFVQTLHKELAQLGTGDRFEAIVIGSGTIVQGDHNTVVGAGGFYAQDSTVGDVVMPGGSKTVINKLDDGKPDSEQLRRSYLNRLYAQTRNLSLSGVDPKAASDAKAQIGLQSVYTALLTVAVEREAFDLGKAPRQPDQESKRLSALDQLNRHPHFVLLGDPGSGKSTFVNFVTLCLTGALLGKTPGLNALTAPLPDDEGNDTETKQPWAHGYLLPVRVVLRDFAARGLPAVGKKAGCDHLWRFVAQDLATASLADYDPHLRKELLEKGGLLLLDGLDEVPEASQRRVQIKDVVLDFAATFPRCRIVVTSRTYAYQQQAWQLPEFVEAELAPFSDGQIRRFVDRWYAHIGTLRQLPAADQQGRAALLKQAIFGSNRLRGLAERPLLLTLTASLHAWRGGSLPEKREELYADAVEL
ncbi:MAG: NACHT domain-containing protein, partial [Chloroflexi bacterium]|nr:NACHT domain-containing protein [Chloroflexota bacterium]